MKFNVTAFALTCGLLWGMGMFLLTWWVIFFDGMTGEATFLARVYRGYSISGTGSVIGLLWGFFDGFIGGLLFAWLYNSLANHFEGFKFTAHPESGHSGNASPAH